MKKIQQSVFILIMMLSPFAGLFAQGRPYEGPEDPAGDISDEREGYMNGNRVLLYFKNKGQIGDIFRFGYNNPRDSKWPNNYAGTRMIDAGTPVVFSKVFVKNDSIPVTNLDEIQLLRSAGQIDSLIFVQSGWNQADQNYERTIRWQFTPVKNYFNPAQDYAAMSNEPNSWPVSGWPSRGFETKWPGEWNGRFGRGIKYADLESYYVFNDAQDLEKIVKRNDPEENLIMDGPRYFPRPGKFIGDLNPDVTVQKGYPWGGLGLRLAARGFQWNNPEAKDIVFWEYDISNISDYDLPVSGFGYDFNMAVGDEHLPDDDIGYFTKDLNMVYIWDYDGIGVGGVEPGVFAMAFLESPGLAYDGIDNDDDGLVDEKRDNLHGELVNPYYSITDLGKFLDFYGLDEDDLHEHYEGDEDQDWQDGFDANNNGSYAIENSEGLWEVEPGEFPGDDVGLDGVGPLDLNYFGPDEGECNHKPDFSEGIGCEPNFAATDISESDMLGLTTFRMKSDGERGSNNWNHQDDETCYEYLNAFVFDEFTGAEPEILMFTATSSTFTLYKGRTERISISLLHAYESLSEISASSHIARNLFVLKKTAQVIYEADYRFAQPPLMPTLYASAADGKVILTWDDAADKLTHEPFLNNINDFEGYKLYRATDKYFQDAEIVTDNQGAKASKKPIFQCDLIDLVFGNADYGEVGGVEYYLGDDTGITHRFVDHQVENGRTYYYALVAYDFGAPEIGDGISPTENNITMELDESENIIRMGKNVAVVSPHQRAAGYQDPSLSMVDSVTIGNAVIKPLIFDYKNVKANHTYRVKFKRDTLGYIVKDVRYRHPMDAVVVNNGIMIYDTIMGDKLVYEEDVKHFPKDNMFERDDKSTLLLSGRSKAIKSTFYRSGELLTDSFDGVQLILKGLNAYMPIEHQSAIPENGINETNTGWLVGDAAIKVQASRFEYYGFPYTYDIVFTNDDSASFPRLDRKTAVYNLGGGESPLLFDQALSFYVINKQSIDSTGQFEKCELVVEDLNENGQFDLREDRILVGHAAVRKLGASQIVTWGGTVFGFDFLQAQNDSELPKPDDIYRFDFMRPFSSDDSLTFTIEGPVNVAKGNLNSTMDDIKVVPNPYVMSNAMEQAVANKFLNQRRRIMFTHIPAQCTIRIFTSSGVLVDKIDVENEPSDGTVHWDLLSKEDLEIAAGMYVYHIESAETGNEKIGKFAIIK
jgi:hypothetical protein